MELQNALKKIHSFFSEITRKEITLNVFIQKNILGNTNYLLNISDRKDSQDVIFVDSKDFNFNNSNLDHIVNNITNFSNNKLSNFTTFIANKTNLSDRNLPYHGIDEVDKWVSELKEQLSKYAK